MAEVFPVKPFQFRLQTKLDITAREEQLARDELHTKLLARDIVQAELEKVNDKLFGVEVSIKQLFEGSFCIEKVLLLKAFVPVLKALRTEKEEEMINCEISIEKARALLIEKIKEAKILNNLRDKEWQSYLLELLKEEQKIIDEIATNSHYKANLS